VFLLMIGALSVPIETPAGFEAAFDLSVYYPILLYFGAVVLFAASAILGSWLIGPRKQTAAKLMPYESGMDPIGDARQQFDVKFYLIAILFLVFDVELLFLYPWAATYQETGIVPRGFRTVVFVEVLLFLATVVVAYIYAWRRGVF